MLDTLLAACASVTFITGSLGACLRHPFLVLQFVRRLGYLPHACDPRTKHEKLLWRKIVDRNPLFPVLADKLAAKTYVTARCPELRVAAVLWSGETADEIPACLIRPGVVVKTNNGSGRNIVVEDPAPSVAAVRKRVADWLRKPYAGRNGEWPYGRIRPRAFIERRIEPKPGQELIDISCHVAGGRCLIVNIDREAKQETESVGLFDPDGRRLDARVREGRWWPPYPELPADFNPPGTLARAVDAAVRLAPGGDYMRIDFMSVGDDLYFCECTLFPIGGFSVISGGIDDRIAAAWDLRSSWFLTQPQSASRGLYAWLVRRFGHDARRATAGGS